jgi:hypothetical protein
MWSRRSQLIIAEPGGCMCLASLRHISGVERILPKGQNTLVFYLNGRSVVQTTSSLHQYRDVVKVGAL